MTYELTFEEYQKFFDNHLSLYLGFGNQHGNYTKFFDKIEEKQKEYGYTNLKLHKINDPLENENLKPLDIGEEHFNNILTPEHLNKIFDRYNNLHNYINHFVETVNYNIDILFDEDEDKSGLYLSLLGMPNEGEPYTFSYKNENENNSILSYNMHIKYLYDLKDLYASDEYTENDNVEVSKFLYNKLGNLATQFITKSKYNYSQGKATRTLPINVPAYGKVGNTAIAINSWTTISDNSSYGIDYSEQLSEFLTDCKDFDKYYIEFNKNPFSLKNNKDIFFPVYGAEISYMTYFLIDERDPECLPYKTKLSGHIKSYSLLLEISDNKYCEENVNYSDNIREHKNIMGVNPTLSDTRFPKNNDLIIFKTEEETPKLSYKQMLQFYVTEEDKLDGNTTIDADTSLYGPQNIVDYHNGLFFGKKTWENVDKDGYNRIKGDGQPNQDFLDFSLNKSSIGTIYIYSKLFENIGDFGFKNIEDFDS